MNALKRMVATLNGSLEAFITQVENHEAITTVAIQEIKRNADRARGQLHRIRKDIEILAKQQESLEMERQRWIERARASRSDEARALSCVGRVKAVEESLTKTIGLLSEKRRLEEQLSRDLRCIDERVQSLRLRRNDLASRQASAAALDSLSEADGNRLEALFERWEMKVASHETSPSTFLPVADELDARFSKEEEAVALKARLAEILKAE